MQINIGKLETWYKFELAAIAVISVVIDFYPFLFFTLAIETTWNTSHSTRAYSITSEFSTVARIWQMFWFCRSGSKKSPFATYPYSCDR